MVDAQSIYPKHVQYLRRRHKNLCRTMEGKRPNTVYQNADQNINMVLMMRGKKDSPGDYES